MIRFLVDEDFNNDILRGLQRAAREFPPDAEQVWSMMLDRLKRVSGE